MSELAANVVVLSNYHLICNYCQLTLWAGSPPIIKSEFDMPISDGDGKVITIPCTGDLSILYVLHFIIQCTAVL